MHNSPAQMHVCTHTHTQMQTPVSCEAQWRRMNECSHVFMSCWSDFLYVGREKEIHWSCEIITGSFLFFTSSLFVCRFSHEAVHTYSLGKTHLSLWGLWFWAVMSLTPVACAECEVLTQLRCECSWGTAQLLHHIYKNIEFSISRGGVCCHNVSELWAPRTFTCWQGPRTHTWSRSTAMLRGPNIMTLHLQPFRVVRESHQRAQRLAIFLGSKLPHKVELWICRHAITCMWFWQCFFFSTQLWILLDPDSAKRRFFVCACVSLGLLSIFVLAGLVGLATVCELSVSVGFCVLSSLYRAPIQWAARYCTVQEKILKYKSHKKNQSLSFQQRPNVPAVNYRPDKEKKTLSLYTLCALIEVML